MDTESNYTAFDRENKDKSIDELQKEILAGQAKLEAL